MPKPRTGEALEAYMERVLGEGWREGMTEDDARAVEELKRVMEQGQPEPPARVMDVPDVDAADGHRAAPLHADDAGFTPISAEDDAALFRGVAEDAEFTPLITEAPAAVLAGFAPHEWPVVRRVLDETGGAHVRLLPLDAACAAPDLPCPSVLHLSARDALPFLREPRWDAPAALPPPRAPSRPVPRALVFVGLAPAASLTLARAVERSAALALALGPPLGVAVVRLADADRALAGLAYSAAAAAQAHRRALGVP